MKGLLYKEWCLGKKDFVGFYIVAIMMSVLGILVFLSMEYGNLTGFKNQASIYLLIFTYVSFLLSLFSVHGCIQGIYVDYESEWIKYSYTLPYSHKKIIGIKYMACGLALLVSFIYGLVNYSILNVLAKQDFDVKIIGIMIAILAVSVTLYSMIIPVSFLLKKGRIVGTICGVVYIVLYLVVGMYFMNMDMSKAKELLKDVRWLYNNRLFVLVVLFAFVTGIITYISYIISCKIYKRRMV